MKVEAAVVLAILVLSAAAHAADDSPATRASYPAADRQARQTMTPAYPARALQERLEGEVQVCFHVDREGRTSRIAVRKSSHRIFEKPAIQAVRESTYMPLKDDETLSGIKTCRTFRFLLNPAAIEESGESSGSVDES